MELADLIVFHKADKEFMEMVKTAMGQVKTALHLMPPHESADWIVPIQAVSSYQKTGFEDLMTLTLRFFAIQQASGAFSQRRKQQHIHWFKEGVAVFIDRLIMENDNANTLFQKLRDEVSKGNMHPFHAAEHFVKHLHWDKS